jgi:hypothetical protein
MFIKMARDQMLSFAKNGHFFIYTANFHIIYLSINQGILSKFIILFLSFPNDRTQQWTSHSPKISLSAKPIKGQEASCLRRR